MEVNAAQIIDIANIGAKVINPENGKATYELVRFCFLLCSKTLVGETKRCHKKFLFLT